jgi:hypothetical protein
MDLGLTSRRSGWLLFEWVEAARPDIDFSVRKFLDVRSDYHVTIV